MASMFTDLPTRYPRWVTAVMLTATLILAALAAAPTIWPHLAPGLHPARIDTDPENMLDEHEAVRVFHDRMKAALGLHDIVVVGVVNEEHPQGVFNPESLRRVRELTDLASTLRGEAIGVDDPHAGVVATDMIAPSRVDNIEQGGPGEVRFEWLMARVPETDEEALGVQAEPLLVGQNGVGVST